MKRDPKISVAIPLFNEQENLPELLQRLRVVLGALPGGPHEIVAVDDGSHDATRRMLEELEIEPLNLVVLSFSRNFGHQAALTAGLDHATGDVIVLMDGDLQDPPEIIPTLLARYHEGFDVVYALRETREAAWYMRASYAAFYRLMGLFSNVRMPLDSGDFSLLSRRVADAIRALPEHHRYLRGLRAWAGFRQTGVPVQRPARFRGTTKYSLSKLVGLALDGIFSFTEIPLRMASFLGALTIAASSLFVLYAAYARIVLQESPQGFTAIIAILVFVSGVQLLFLGVIGEYVGRIYNEVKNRPKYVLERTIRRDR